MQDLTLISLNLSDGSKVRFYPYPLDTGIVYHWQRGISENLSNILLEPEFYKSLHIQADQVNKIFLGFATQNPNGQDRFPIWLPSDFLSSHLLVSGSIGSGKTSLTYRLIAGALNTYGTVIIGEAKGGRDGGREGAAFTDLASYLGERLNIPTYRWPRGDCWFNPLLYLTRRKDRNTFLLTICQQIDVGGGELQAYVQRAANIASLIIEWMQIVYFTETSRIKFCTLRRLVKFLQEPESLQDEIKKSIASFRKKFQEASDPRIGKKSERIMNSIESIEKQLEMLNFFILKNASGREKAIMTLNALSLFYDLINQEDLLYYSEAQEGLEELKIDKLLYERSLVVISQPLNDPSSKIIGPLFWDSLLSRVLELGPNPDKKNNKDREKIAVFLDETHRLPVGRLGESGDFLREYKVGLVEIIPTVVDKERWERNKHIYQTVISLSPGVKDVIELIYEQLPNQAPEPFRVTIDVDSDFSAKVKPEITTNNFNSDQDYPGASLRVLRDTGKYSALLQSKLLSSGIFWIDMESDLIAKFKVLLKDAIGDKEKPNKRNAVDYALGLVKEFRW